MKILSSFKMPENTNADEMNLKWGFGGRKLEVDTKGIQNWTQKQQSDNRRIKPKALTRDYNHWRKPVNSWSSPLRVLLEPSTAGTTEENYSVLKEN